MSRQASTSTGWGGYLAGEHWERLPSSYNRGWRYSIDTGVAIDTDDVGDEDVPAIGAKIAAALRLARDWGKDRPVGHELLRLANEFEDVRTVDEFDELLDELYDWGDEHRVIIRAFR